jgi:hypothetical protein
VWPTLAALSSKILVMGCALLVAPDLYRVRGREVNRIAGRGGGGAGLDCM